MAQSSRPRSGSRYEPLSDDDAGNEAFPTTTLRPLRPRSGTHPFPPTRIERHKPRSRSFGATPYPRTEGQSQGLHIPEYQLRPQLEAAPPEPEPAPQLSFKDRARVSRNMREDMDIFRDEGWCVDYPGGRLGQGLCDVYRGHYTVDADGNQLEPVQSFDQALPENRFAVKVKNLIQASNPVKECIENERYILSQLDHMNVVQIHLFNSMGRVENLPFGHSPNLSYTTGDRVYIFLEYSDQGTLRNWMTYGYPRFSSNIRIDFMRDMFWGMHYLHYMGIHHHDAHTSNVLISTGQNRLIAKWADFGQSQVVRLNEPREIPEISRSDFNYGVRKDVTDMFSNFQSILQYRDYRQENRSEKNQLDSFNQMTRQRNKTLDQLANQFRNILQE